MGTLILYFVGHFQSISHYWTFPTIQKIIFPHHSIFLVCFSNYYHHLPDISLLRYWFGLGHLLFSHSILSVGNAYVLSWLFLFICQILCEVFASISVLPHFSHSSFKSHILKIHIIFLINLSSSLIYSFFLLFIPESLATSLTFPSSSMTRSNKFTHTSGYLLSAYLVPNAQGIVVSKICRSLTS